MMATHQQYYYLVAGLPDLLPEQDKLPFSRLEFREELREHLTPDDFRRLCLLFLPIDNRNLLHLLQKDGVPPHPGGLYTIEQLEEARRDPGLLYPYLHTFLRAYTDDAPLRAGMSWENQLTELYYDSVIAEGGDFLRAWMLFDRDLRNLLAALNIRRHQLPLEGQLIGHNHVVDAIIHSHAPDFGLSQEYPFVEKLIRLEEEADILQREWEIDHLRWDVIDELNTFHYFSLEVILGFVLRLEMVERWVHLDPDRGAALFRRLVQQLEHNIELSNETSLP